MPFPRLDASSAVHSRSPSRSLPDAVIRAFSSSLTTTVFSQRSMRRFDTSPRRAAPKGQTFISCTAPRSITQLPSNLPRSWHTPVAQRPLVDPKVASDLGDGLAGLEHHLHGLSLELRAEPPPRLWHGQILSAQSHCPRSLVHPSARPDWRVTPPAGTALLRWADVHVSKIAEAFGKHQLAGRRPSDARRSTRMGPEARRMSPHGPPSVRCWRPVRTHRGPSGLTCGGTAGRATSQGQMS